MTDVEIMDRFESLESQIRELENKLNSEVKGIERDLGALERQMTTAQNDITDLERASR